MSWYNNSGDIVISTRVRIARNINNLPFPHKMNNEQIVELCSKIKKAVENKEFSFGKLNYISCDSAKSEMSSMVERHIISPNFATNYNDRAFLLSDDETVSIMIAEEDHIRIQVIMGDNNLEKALEIAKEVDNTLLENLDIAYSEQLGFLTACPTNLGTALRASLMLHIPAMESIGVVPSLKESISKIGFTLRGLYGEGSKAEGGFYQVSNQVTLGITEEDAIKNLKGISEQIISRETTARNEFNKDKLEDLVYRALGTLKYAKIMSSSEATGLLSTLKSGISQGILTHLDKSLPIKLFIETMPNMLQTKHGILTPSDRDILRANIIRESLKGCE